jgi:hypothetical protein
VLLEKGLIVKLKKCICLFYLLLGALWTYPASAVNVWMGASSSKAHRRASSSNALKTMSRQALDNSFSGGKMTRQVAREFFNAAHAYGDAGGVTFHDLDNETRAQW